MAHSYFSPRPARRHSYSEMQELSGDLEQSIFIFPNPRTERDPPSPLSIPTDVSFPSTTTTERRGRRTSSVSGVSEWATISGRSVSADTSLRSPLVEVWEMSDDAEGEELTGDETPAPTVPNVLNRQQLRRLQQERYALGRCPYPSTFVFSDGRLQLRSRKQSSVSASPFAFDDPNNTGSASLSDPELQSFPHAPPRRLPLLAFFSSLFSIENTTIHLLSRPSHPHASPLFAGARLHATDDNDITLDEKRALFSSSPTASLKAGVEVAADSFVTLDNVFALPLPPLPFTYIWDLVAGVYNKTVPKRVRLRAKTSA